ncbi:hypothetical protein E2C01_094979 [Portunus trituberculatus]|uniref:Uncharacterized protein n=1 Tax=Portunus trituberculatus TaxID=210409 RepID=A0A5B7K343_PORTR|nr:hypothetical protein [Portunus trituberculatus]
MPCDQDNKKTKTFTAHSPLNDHRCAGRECVVNTLPSARELRWPSRRYSSGELPSVSLPPPTPIPPPAAARDSSAGMVRGGAVPLASGTLERDRALPLSPARSLLPPPPWLAERRSPTAELPSPSAVPAGDERRRVIG